MYQDVSAFIGSLRGQLTRFGITLKVYFAGVRLSMYAGKGPTTGSTRRFRQRSDGRNENCSNFVKFGSNYF